MSTLLDETTLDQIAALAQHNEGPVRQATTVGCFTCMELLPGAQVTAFDDRSAMCPKCSGTTVLVSPLALDAGPVELTVGMLEQLYRDQFTRCHI